MDSSYFIRGLNKDAMSRWRTYDGLKALANRFASSKSEPLQTSGRAMAEAIPSGAAFGYVPMNRRAVLHTAKDGLGIEAGLQNSKNRGFLFNNVDINVRQPDHVATHAADGALRRLTGEPDFSWISPYTRNALNRQQAATREAQVPWKATASRAKVDPADLAVSRDISRELKSIYDYGGAPPEDLMNARKGVLDSLRQAWAGKTNQPVKQADAGQAFAGAVNDMSAQQLKADAMGDVGRMALASLGVGLAGRGAVGLYNVIQRTRAKKNKSGPALLPLPFPVEKQAGFLAGDYATNKAGIPWYGPAMLGVGLGGMAAGWGGMDRLLDSRRKAEQDAEIEKARADFHDALMAQYDKPVRGLPKKKKEESVMAKVGSDLDALWGTVSGFIATREKQALDLTNMAGAATGGYGIYAGLSGLLTGSLIYNATKKRSRQAVLDKAMQKRDRRRFMQSPTEIYAVPEPVETGGEDKLAMDKEAISPDKILNVLARLTSKSHFPKLGERGKGGAGDRLNRFLNRTEQWTTGAKDRLENSDLPLDEIARQAAGINRLQGRLDTIPHAPGNMDATRLKVRETLGFPNDLPDLGPVPRPAYGPRSAPKPKSAPAPAPKPELAPAPAPKPEPAPAPAPAYTPEDAPAPQPAGTNWKKILGIGGGTAAGAGGAAYLGSRMLGGNPSSDLPEIEHDGSPTPSTPSASPEAPSGAGAGGGVPSSSMPSHLLPILGGAGLLAGGYGLHKLLSGKSKKRKEAA